MFLLLFLFGLCFAHALLLFVPLSLSPLLATPSLTRAKAILHAMSHLHLLRENFRRSCKVVGFHWAIAQMTPGPIDLVAGSVGRLVVVMDAIDSLIAWQEFVNLSACTNLQKGLSPEFRATRLSRRKKGPSLEVVCLLIFLCLRPKRPKKKICAKPWLPVIRA